MTAPQRTKVGELRPTQLMFTFGVGAIVDLPAISALVMGLDDWRPDPGVAREIVEERLLLAVRQRLGPQVQKLLSPPVMPEGGGSFDPFGEAARIGVPVATFPRWLLCPRCQLLAPLSSGLFERKDDPYHPERTRYLHVNCNKANKPLAVPARFLVACRNGHLDDFPWVSFVHRGPSDCRAVLRLIEYGLAGEARDLEVRCETCQARRRMSEAFGEAGKATMPLCRGRRPHLRDFDEEPCPEQAKAILLGSSNLWFPDVLTTLAIPTASTRLDQLVESHWATLKQAGSLHNIEYAFNIGLLGEFYGYSSLEIWQAVERRQQQIAAGEEESGTLDLKRPEWELFSHPEAHVDSPDLRLRVVPAPAGFAGVLERVVLVERMREVRAIVGFTRLDAPGEWGDDPTAAARRMPISRSKPAWVPAAEVRGEGIFLQFREDTLQTWLGQRSIQNWDEAFSSSHLAWRKARFIPNPEAHFPGLRFVLIHSLAHALMRQLVLECGYTAASLRERIYSRNPGAGDGPPMAGVLLYTAAPDSEGTLGGLVSLGEPDELRRHLLAALRDAQLCASDPLCAEHAPSQRGITLHAAACHACLFAPETSCECGNRYLDRSVLVRTVERDELAFFQVAA
jgi:hypothetical protein